MEEEEKKVDAGSEAQPAEEPAAELDRRSALVGVVTGFIGGGISGFFAATLKPAEDDALKNPPRAVSAPRPAASFPKPASSGGVRMDPAKAAMNLAHPSFAQQGEDIVVVAMLRDVAEINQPTYLDVGAFEPVYSNNTYLMYLLGGHGVLVEPNPVKAEKLRKERGARDTVLEIGIGATDSAEADYWVFDNDDGQLNTFSKTQSDELIKRGAKLQKVIKRKLVKMNDILAEHFKDKAPDYLSLDVEGMDLDILKSMDFDKWRPIVICVETSQFGTGDVEQEVIDLLVKKGYEVRGGSFVNTIFLDKRFRKAKKK